VRRKAEAQKLLRESGFKVEDCPHYLMANPSLIGHAKGLPQKMRAEYLESLLQFFRIYEQLDERARAQMLRQFRARWREELARKGSNH
jgi:hypothetical protein